MISQPPADSSESLYKHAESRLGDGERIISHFETDLNASLHFHSGVIVLTDQRLLHVEQPRNESIRFKAWKLTAIDDLVLDELGATAVIHLLQGGTLAYEWRATSGCVREADAFLARFKERQRALRLDPSIVSDALEEVIDDDDEDDEDPFAAKEDGVKRNPLLRLMLFAKPWYKLMTLGLLLTLASIASSLIGPWITMSVVDNVLIPLQSETERPHVKHIYRFAVSLGGVALLTWLLNWGKTFVIARLAERVTSRMRRNTYEHLQKLSLTYFNRKRTGDLISRIGTDTDHISLFISVNLIDFISDVFMFVGVACILVDINPVLALAALGPAPVIGWMVGRVRSHLRGGFAAASRAWSQMNNVLSDTIPGVRVVKAFAQEQREVMRFRAADQHIFDTNDRVNRTWSFFTPMIELLTDMGLITVWAVGAWSVQRGNITVGVLTGFIYYISRLYGRVESMSRFFASAQRAATSAHRVFELLDVEPDMPSNDGSHKVGRLKGEIEFRGVKFRHGPRQVIKGVDL
ncbi:MAG: putative transporter ATP-binding protein, partial [Verrucomicrobiaceae bacterium]|nr:putative transporter ATP-binding protein [Verrucomicrobiaceae bacterium]